MMKSELKEYLLTLNPETLKLYFRIEAMHQSTADTLDDDFQILGKLLEVFEQFAIRRKAGTIDLPEVVMPIRTPKKL